MILQGCALNNNSYILKDETTGEEKRIGNQTECSMLDFVDRSLRNTGRPEDSYEAVR